MSDDPLRTGPEPPLQRLSARRSAMSRERDLADQLETIGAELDELAMDRLMTAASEGETRRPQRDRTLTQARRAIEKAVRLLRDADADAADGST